MKISPGCHQKLHACSSARVGDKIYLIGGSNDHLGSEEFEALSTLNIFDLSLKKWEVESEDGKTKLPKLTTGRWCSSALVARDFIVISGGVDSDHKKLKSIEIYDTEQCIWLPFCEELDKCRAGHVSVLLNEKNSILIFGGFDKHSQVLSTVQSIKLKVLHPNLQNDIFENDFFRK